MATFVPEDVVAFLRTLAEGTAAELWRVARKEVTSSRLVLPNYRSGKRRVSEQEARSVAQRLVAQSNYFFSIETPTAGTHKFSGHALTPPRSAQHDLSFYTSADPASLFAHAEFKQGHKSGETGVKVISKDLMKLIDSQKHCLWFHSFPKPTENEFKKLSGFFQSALKTALEGREPDPAAKVVLALCAVVEPEAWIVGPITWAELGHAIDAFPVASTTPHIGWTSLPVEREVREQPAVAELDFVDLEPPQEEEQAVAVGVERS